jgi:hypothetical protein
MDERSWRDYAGGARERKEHVGASTVGSGWATIGSSARGSGMGREKATLFVTEEWCARENRRHSGGLY